MFLDESMRGLEDWRFPVTFAAVDGDHIVVKWDQVLPSGHRQSGVSTMRYAGDGQFDYEEDLLNMVHVLEDLQAAGWRPGPGFRPPPPTRCATSASRRLAEPPVPDRSGATAAIPAATTIESDTTRATLSPVSNGSRWVAWYSRWGTPKISAAPPAAGPRPRCR